MTVKRANFLKGNLLIISWLTVRCHRQSLWMQVREYRSIINLEAERIQSLAVLARTRELGISCEIRATSQSFAREDARIRYIQAILPGYQCPLREECGQ